MKSVLALFLIIITPISHASEYSIEEIIDKLNSLCLVSTKYSVKASGGINVKLFKSKSISADGEYVETDINGLLQNLQGDMAKKELTELRKCIGPYRAKIMAKLLGEDVSSLVTPAVILEEVNSIINEKCPEIRLLLSESLSKLYPDNSDLILLILSLIHI